MAINKKPTSGQRINYTIIQQGATPTQSSIPGHRGPHKPWKAQKVLMARNDWHGRDPSCGRLWRASDSIDWKPWVFVADSRMSIVDSSMLFVDSALRCFSSAEREFCDGPPAFCSFILNQMFEQELGACQR